MCSLGFGVEHIQKAYVFNVFNVFNGVRMKKKAKKKKDPKKVKMGKRVRRRGLSFERDVANIFKAKSIFKDAKRHLEYQADEAALGIDIVNVGDFAPQCKRGKKYAQPNKIFEVLKTDDNIPLLISKADNSPVLVTLDFEKFLELVEDYLINNTECEQWDFLS